MTDSLMDNYNPLYDVHLRQYFALPHMQKHLLKMGLLEKTISGSGDEVLARHHAMMDLMLKNRETQLQRMAEIKQKLDAAEKVETCRRIRSGQSPESFRRAKPSRSLSRGRPAASGRQRRFSNSFEDKEMVQKLEKDHAEPNEFDPKDTYKRLSAKSKKYNYLHKMDDGTLTSYKDNLKSQLERLERFRELSFGVHSMARQPAPAQTSWFFRRRSLPSIHATSTGIALNESMRSNQKIRGRRMSPGIKLDASNDSRVSCPPTMRKRRDSNSRLPPIQPTKRSQTAQVVKSAPTKLPSTNGHPPRGRSVVKKSTNTSSVPKLPPVAGVFAGGAAAVGIAAAAAVAAAQSPEPEPVPKDPSPAREEPEPEPTVEPTVEQHEIETVHGEPEHAEEEVIAKHVEQEEKPVEYEEIQHEETYHEESAASPKEVTSDESEPEYAESDNEEPVVVQNVVQQHSGPEPEHHDVDSVHAEERADSPVHEISIVKHEATPRQLSEDEDYVPQETRHQDVSHEEHVAEEPETSPFEAHSELPRDEEPIQHEEHAISYEEVPSQDSYEKENQDPEDHHHIEVIDIVQPIEDHEPLAHSTPLGEPEEDQIQTTHHEIDDEDHEIHKREVEATASDSISSEDLVENQVSEDITDAGHSPTAELERTSQDHEESYGFAEHRPSFTEDEEPEPVEEHFHQETHVEQSSEPHETLPIQHEQYQYNVEEPTPRSEIDPDLSEEREGHVERELDQDEPMEQEAEPEHQQEVPEEDDLMKDEDEDDQKVPEHFQQHLESNQFEEPIGKPEQPHDGEPVAPKESEHDVVDDVEEPCVKQEAVLQYEEVDEPVRQTESSEIELQHHDSGVTEQHHFTSEAHEEHIERHESPVYSHHEEPTEPFRDNQEYFDSESQHLHNQSYRSDVHDTLVQQFEEEAKAESPIHHDEVHHSEPQEDQLSERSHHTQASEHSLGTGHPEEPDTQMMDSYHQDIHHSEVQHHEDHHQDSARIESQAQHDDSSMRHPKEFSSQMTESYHHDLHHSPDVHHHEDQIHDFHEHRKSPVHEDHYQDLQEHHVTSAHAESPVHSEHSHILESHHYEPPHNQGLQNEEHMEVGSHHSQEELIQPVQHLNSEPARKSPEDDNMSTDSMIIHDEEDNKQENHYQVDPMTHSVYDRSSPANYEHSYGNEEHQLADSPLHPAESHEHLHEQTPSPVGSLPDLPESRHSVTSAEGTRLPETMVDMNQSFYQQSEHNMISSVHHVEEDDEENNNEDGRSTKSMESNELTRLVYNGNVDDEEVHHQNVSSL